MFCFVWGRGGRGNVLFTKDPNLEKIGGGGREWRGVGGQSK